MLWHDAQSQVACKCVGILSRALAANLISRKWLRRKYDKQLKANSPEYISSKLRELVMDDFLCAVSHLG